MPTAVLLRLLNENAEAIVQTIQQRTHEWKAKNFPDINGLSPKAKALREKIMSMDLYNKPGVAELFSIMLDEDIPVRTDIEWEVGVAVVGRVNGKDNGTARIVTSTDSCSCNEVGKDSYSLYSATSAIRAATDDETKSLVLMLIQSNPMKIAQIMHSMTPQESEVDNEQEE